MVLCITIRIKGLMRAGFSLCLSRCPPVPGSGEFGEGLAALGDGIGEGDGTGGFGARIGRLFPLCGGLVQYQDPLTGSPSGAPSCLLDCCRRILTRWALNLTCLPGVAAFEIWSRRGGGCLG